VRTGQTRLDGFNERIIALYARGLTVWLTLSSPTRPLRLRPPDLLGTDGLTDALDAATEHRTRELADSARRGDQAALQLFDSYGERVGVGASVLMTVCRPASVVIGGSAARFLSLFATGFDRALSRSDSFAWTPPCREAELGALSSAIGAAVLARPDASDLGSDASALVRPTGIATDISSVRYDLA
jgi:predicted NBD/HSP70 family sugar kinase